MALPFGDLYVLHHLAQFFQGLLGFRHAAFFHQLLNAVHHRLKIVLGHFHALLVLALLAVGVLFTLLLITAGKLAHVIIRRFAQFLHQFRDFLFAGTVLHGLGQTVLRAFKPFAGILKIAFFKNKREVPHVFGQFGNHFIA